MTESNNDKPGLHIPPRFIPTPTTISPEAQAFMSMQIPIVPLPDLADKPGWRKYIDGMNQMITGQTSMLAQPYPADSIAHKLSASTLYEVKPKTLQAKNEKRAILFAHGGGFVLGGGMAVVYAAQPMASLAQTRIYSLDYRMPPDYPFPAPLDDVVEAYRWLLERYEPENIAFWGGSAGGNLAAAAILKARDVGLPMPAACALQSPAVDCTESGDSYETNRMLDILLKERSPQLFTLYAGGHDLRDPILSPVFADYSQGFSPTILVSGTRDLLLSSTVNLHRALRRAGVEAELHIWEAMCHMPFIGAPEEKEVMMEQICFLRKHTTAS